MPTKSDAVNDIASEHEMTKGKAEAVIDTLTDTIMRGLKEGGGEFAIKGFGTFRVLDRPERQGRNPQTGETITIKPKRKITFRPHKVMRDYLGQPQ